MYRTPVVIAFNNRAVSAPEAPQDWDEILEPRWHDLVLIRDPMASGTMRAIWGYIIERSLRETGDTTAGMAWLRALDRNTKTYALNPAILDQKLAREEGVVTLWDLPDILISQGKGMPFGYLFPRSGTVVIDDAIALVTRLPARRGRAGLHRLRRRDGGAAAGRAQGVPAARAAGPAGGFPAGVGGRGGPRP